MKFENPWLWLIAPPLVAYVLWLSRRSYAHLEPTARKISVALRLLLLCCLLAATARPAWRSTRTSQHLVFALDVSKSITKDNLDAALADINNLAKEVDRQNSDHRTTIIAFGEQPLILRQTDAPWADWKPEERDKLLYQTTLTRLYQQRAEQLTASGTTQPATQPSDATDFENRIATIEKFRDDIAGEHTDVERALRLALNCGLPDERKTVYLYTDANFNRGQWQSVWPADKNNATIHVVALDRPNPPEVAAADLQLPAAVKINQAFTAEVRLTAAEETKAELQTFRDGYLADKQTVTLKPGENTFKIAGLHFGEKGFHTVETVVRAEKDTKLENNTIRSLVVVPGEARVLYVDANEDQIPYLKSALEIEGMSVEARPATGVPQNLSELLSFDAFILSNVPADKLSLRQMRMIKTYVQDFGGGFIMLGGDESFGLGGYYNTPVEEILPVRMPIQKDMIRPSLALMLVIDKSGSMEGAKIQIAKRAAIATSEAINPRDQIGLIGFDGESRVLLELTPAADRGTISGAIAALEASGGTFLYPALQDAHSRLQGSNARKKHVIVLSDGQTQGFGYEEFVNMMAADGITLSAVGIGEGADMKLLEAIASAGGGRAYFTNDFYTIPQIFTREALRASKSMLVERLVQPVAVGTDVCLNEIDPDELPLLTGYVATTPKSAANLILASDSGDPLLAKWRYGLGQTVAFTSETKPRWAEDWIEWEDFAKFWSQLVRSVTGEGLAKTIFPETGHTITDDGVRLIADLHDDAGNFVSNAGVSLTALDDQGRPTALQVTQTGPGLFEATLPRFRYGEDQHFAWKIDPHAAHAIQSTQPATGETTPANKPDTQTATDVQTAAYGFVQSFSPEFQTLGVNTETLNRLKTRATGETMRVGQSRLVLNAATGSTWIVLWPYFLIAALILAPLDILCRRLS